MTAKDIQTLRACQGLLIEIDRLRELDKKEQQTIIGGQQLDGMPHGQGSNKGLDEVIERAEELHSKRIQAIKDYEEQVNRCEEILSGIEDITIRALARVLYVEQIPISRAAQIVHISVSTANRIKAKMEKRHISGENGKNGTK